MTTRPLLCLVTNRRRLAEAFGRPLTEARALLLRQIEGAVAGRVDLVQVREGDLDAGALQRLVREALSIAAGSSTRIVVNDRVDVAMAAGAAGVHLRESSITAADARRLAPHILVGRSVHSVAAAGIADPVDYLIAGTVFRTPSKPDDVEGIGVAGLAQIVRAANGVPVLGIGGITAAVIGCLRSTGAAGAAAIGAFIPGGGIDELTTRVQQSADALRFAFDTGSPVL